MRHQMHIVEFPPVRCNNLIAGITAVVGIIGGVLLITKTTKDFLGKVTDRRKKQTDNEYLCNVCCAEIDPEDAKTFVKCYICHKHICRSIKCADWLPKTAQWECELCQTSKESMAQTSSWVADQISFHQEKLVYPLRARSEIFIPISECNDSSIHFESVSQIGANSATVTAEQKLKIREYVEEVVANLLGGNLDTISVNQLSKSENYLPAPKTNGHLKQNGSIITNHSEAYQEVTPTSTNSPDFTDISETRLRLMIQKIIAETINMQPLSPKHAVSEISLDRRGKTSDNMSLTNGHRYRTEHYFEPKIYQDLLATAVLNKIVDKQLNNHGMLESSSNLTRGDGGGDVDNSAVRHAILDQNFNMENQSTTSGSSVEPHSDCSYTDMEQMINANDDKTPDLIISAGRESVMSDYLASHMVPLPDLSTMATESEEDDYMSVTSSAVGDGTWENNWLFKKKKPTLGGTVAASSVGMLVPDPKEDVRAQIGDKTADEVSDLSELGSDTDDSLEILRTKLDPINDRLINKHLIGGQNNKLVLDELIERSSMISNTMPTDLEQAYTETRNEHVIEASATTEAINADVNQQNNNNSIEQEEAEAILPPAGFEDPSSNPLTGSIAEREYKKWNNAVEMPNNPYAPEALKRRISGSQERFIDLPNISPIKEQNPLELIDKGKLEVDETDKRESDYRRYSRDYYINNSSPSSQTSTPRETPATPTKDNLENTKATKSPATKQTDIDLYKAIPAQVVEDTTSSIDTISQQSVQSGNTTTSDDSDTIKIYDFKKQETTVLRESKTQLEKEPVKDIKPKERPTVLNFSRSESAGNVTTPTRGSTPTAFKFLQPKRKIFDPSQVLSLDDDAAPDVKSPPEKPVIEQEVAQALPSVKALAKAFLMTTKSSQSENRWLRKARTLSHGEKGKPSTPVRSLDPTPSEIVKIEEDLTITSDLSSLETDSSLVYKDGENTKDIPETPLSPTADCTTPTTSTSGNTSPVLVRQGGLKNNIAFFENLKFK